MSAELTAFYWKCLDEVEAAAKAAPGECWRSFGEDDIAGTSVYDEQWLLLSPARYDHDNPLSDRPGATGPQYIQRARDELCVHIARHDPARVLREVEAKRAILRSFAELDADPARLTDPVKHMIWTVMRDHVMLPMAAVYRDHPGYRQEWAP